MGVQCKTDSLVAMINKIYVSSGAAKWSDIKVRGEVLKDLWRHVFFCLYEELG
jgi:hypothetical protein